MDYDYLESIKDDVRQYISDEDINVKAYDDRYDLETELHDELWDNDNVTGNASGSYTFNTWQAEEYLAHNLDLLEEACDEFGCDVGEAIKKGAEYCDVTIRCYLLDQAISEVLDELYN